MCRVFGTWTNLLIILENMYEKYLIFLSDTGGPQLNHKIIKVLFLLFSKIK